MIVFMVGSLQLIKEYREFNEFKRDETTFNEYKNKEEDNQRVRASIYLKNMCFAHRGKRKKMLTGRKCCDSILGIGGHLFAKLRFYE